MFALCKHVKSEDTMQYNTDAWIHNFRNIRHNTTFFEWPTQHNLDP